MVNESPTGEAVLKKQVGKRRPRIEDFSHTFKLFIKNRIAFIGFVIVIIYFAIMILDYADPRWLGVADINTMASWAPKPLMSAGIPSGPTFTRGWWYIFGETEYFVPIFPVMLAALKTDLTYSVAIVTTGVLIGTILGTLSGYFGKLYDEILMRITDIFYSVPTLVLAIAVTYVLGFSLRNVVLALMIIWWPIYARLTRGVTLTIKSNKFVEAATASGSSGIRNVFVHVLPNVLSVVLVQFSLDLGSIIQLFAALDYIGFNRAAPLLPEIGNMLNMGETYLAAGIWWPIVIPGIFLLIFTVAINLMGDGLRDVLDPKLRR
ncbi:MAG: ABC transporter permease [Thermoplasmatales archaeon]